MHEQVNHFIGGRRFAGSGKHAGDVYNPATGECIRQVPFATDDELNAAVASACDAFPAWAATSPLKRSRIMMRYLQLLNEHREQIAESISEEHGKVHADAVGEITRGIEVVEFACGVPHLLKGEVTDNVASGVDSHSLRQPLGVVAGITPFNFPAMVPMWMYPVAIACGNSFILKPSEKDPSTSILLAELFREAGLPDGVFNVLQGDREAVGGLLTHPDIRAVSFVGSTHIARHVYTTAAKHGKRVQALGGAKNHMVIMPDADLDMAADALLGAVYGSAGERCMAISVAVPVTNAVADQLLARLVPRVEALRVGPGTDSSAEMGPLVTREHRDRVSAYVDAGVREGAELLVDGRAYRHPDAHYSDGFYLGGSVFDHVTPEMSIYQDEIFGPVLSVVRAADYGEAVRIIADNPYGNGISIFTRDGDTAQAFANQVEVGMVGVNVPIPVPMAFHSFGGWKDSLFGDHHMHGPEGIRFYTRMKTITTRWPKSDQRTQAEFVMPTLG